MPRVAAVLTGVIVAGWGFAVLSVDLGSDANAATAYIDATVIAVVALASIWLTVGMARLLRRAWRSDSRRPVAASTERQGEPG